MKATSQPVVAGAGPPHSSQVTSATSSPAITSATHSDKQDAVNLHVVELVGAHERVIRAGRGEAVLDHPCLLDHRFIGGDRRAPGRTCRIR